VIGHGANCGRRERHKVQFADAKALAQQANFCQSNPIRSRPRNRWPQDARQRE
jgi:hypothetical protein